MPGYPGTSIADTRYPVHLYPGYLVHFYPGYLVHLYLVHLYLSTRYTCIQLANASPLHPRSSIIVLITFLYSNARVPGYLVHLYPGYRYTCIYRVCRYPPATWYEAHSILYVVVSYSILYVVRYYGILRR